MPLSKQRAHAPFRRRVRAHLAVGSSRRQTGAKTALPQCQPRLQLPYEPCASIRREGVGAGYTWGAWQPTDQRRPPPTTGASGHSALPTLPTILQELPSSRLASQPVPFQHGALGVCERAACCASSSAPGAPHAWLASGNRHGHRESKTARRWRRVQMLTMI